MTLTIPQPLDQSSLTFVWENMTWISVCVQYFTQIQLGFLLHALMTFTIECRPSEEPKECKVSESNLMHNTSKYVFLHKDNNSKG